MTPAEITRISILLISFAFSYWAILGIDFSRFLRKGRTLEAQVISVLLAMALAYLVYEFIFALRVFI